MARTPWAVRAWTCFVKLLTVNIYALDIWKRHFEPDLTEGLFLAEQALSGQRRPSCNEAVRQLSPGSTNHDVLKYFCQTDPWVDWPGKDKYTGESGGYCHYRNIVNSCRSKPAHPPPLSKQYTLYSPTNIALFQGYKISPYLYSLGPF